LISWIVASHDLDVLYANLVASLDWNVDEIVLVDDAPSIAVAYNEGQARAWYPVRCYVHHDVQVLDLSRLRAELLAHTTPAVGMVGAQGSRTPALPWWDGDTLGSVFDARVGAIDFGPGGPCAVLDGLLLATVHDVEWDETIPGWHGYDYDACRQMLARGLPNFCLTDGARMVRHNTTGSFEVDALAGWGVAVDRLREKWGVPVGVG
jgi:hypothetical protein